jgi:hypothetical protein
MPEGIHPTGIRLSSGPAPGPAPGVAPGAAPDSPKT